MKGSLALLVAATLLESSSAFSAVDSKSSSLIRLHPDTANNVLRNLLIEDGDSTDHRSLVMLEGLVSGRRAIGKHLVFLDILPMDLPRIDTTKRKKKAVYDDVISTPVEKESCIRRCNIDTRGASRNEERFLGLCG